MSTAAQLNFLPWVREGAATAIADADDHARPDNGVRGAAQLQATLSVNGGAAAPVTLRLRGPADVLGIDPRQVVRTDPHPGSADFEPNHLVAIEFDRPDFPWLFTPARANAQGQLRPWLCLVVVRVQPGVQLRTGTGTALPVLDIAAPARPADELPDLAEAWAWAHAQVAGASGDAAALRGALEGAPQLSLSRLLCPRLLQPRTDYIACLVPTFELGRRAGLGEDVPDSDVLANRPPAPAWSLTPTAPAGISLPVYHHWNFRTGDGQDFESLVRLLRPGPVPAGLGHRPMDIRAPGFPLPPAFSSGFPAGLLQLEGALKPMGAGPAAPGWPAAAGAAFQGELARIVNTPGRQQELAPGSDPLLAPPLYGRWHAARERANVGATPWFDDLNLDPRHRAIAALGTRVVQEHQEALMASAWEQAADLQQGNQRARQLQLSLAVSTSLHARHMQRLDTDATLRLAGPALGRLPVAAGLTLAGQLQGGPLPPRAASTAMRRLGRQRGPVTRRVVAQGGTRSASVTYIARLNADAAAYLAPATWDIATDAAVFQHMPGAGSTSGPHSFRITPQGIQAAPANPVFTIAAEGQRVVASTPNRYIPGDSPTGRNFRAAAMQHLQRIRTLDLPPIFRPAPLQLDALAATVRTATDPRKTVVALARAVFSSGTGASPGVPPAGSPGLPIETVMAAPRFPQPMVEPLRELSQDLLLPGLDRVPPNTVLGLETNRRFVEAYMVGLNVEMGRELLWRGYPTDQRGTYFDQFWDMGTAAAARRDITPLHTWANRPVGDAATSPAGEQFVMLMRSDLLRRYPSAVIYAAKAVRNARNELVPSRAAADEAHPVFRGHLEPDVSYFGFAISPQAMRGTAGQPGYFIIIQEQPGEPRFGLEADTPRGTGTHLGTRGSAPPGLPLNGHVWGRRAADMAAILRQQPVRVAIHASQFLPT